MTFAIIEFRNVGRSKWSGSQSYQLKEIDADEIADHAVETASRYLLSSEVGAIYNSMKNEGTIIVGGFRPVGTFKVKNWDSLIWRPAK